MRMRLVRLAVLMFCSLLLPACALLPQLPPPPAPLLSPAALDATRTATQVLNVALRARELTLQCVVQVTPQNMNLVALGPLGQRAFTLGYDGHTLTADLSPYVPKDLSPQRVLADLQLALWPLAAWQAQIAGSDSEWQVSEPRAGLRRLYHYGRLIEEVHYADADPWNGRLWLVNLALGYTLDIQSASQ
ncbi:MAG: hypothetical protein JWR16_1599 [Nevskia sp.]|nr:hypothetical protein [Nevskia sp.]